MKSIFTRNNHVSKFSDKLINQAWSDGWNKPMVMFNFAFLRLFRKTWESLDSSDPELRRLTPVPQNRVVLTFPCTGY